MVFDAEIFETNVLSQSSLETDFLGKDYALTKSSSISVGGVDLSWEHSDRSLAKFAIDPIHRRDRIETPIITTQPTFDSLTGLDANTPLVAASAATKTYYIAPNGSDLNTGTINKPFATIQKAHDLARPGDTIYVRGGTYKLPKNKPVNLSKNGTKDNPIKLFAYRAERVILDASNWSRLDANGNNINAVVIHTGDRWHVKGISITGGPWTGYLAAETSYNKWERLNIYGNDNTGFTLYGDRNTNNLILNSNFHHNYDPLEYGQDADGLAIKFGSGTGNIIRGVRSFANSDDGIDLWEFRSPVTIENTWSYKNGYDLWGAGDKFEGNGNGYKLSGGEDPIPAVNHIVRKSLAWGNATSGFEDNGNPGSIKLYNNTSFNNGSENYQLKWGKHVLRNNISVGDAGVDIAQRVDDVKNSWTLPVTVNKDDFLSLNSNVAEGTRVNGQLPISDFLKLKVTSDLVDAGVNIGLSFKGSAPDLGAYETNPQASNNMTLRHEARPHGVPDYYDWADKPRLGYGNEPPKTWSAITAWGQVYEPVQGNPATNTRVQIKNIQSWILSKKDGKWHLVQSSKDVAGAAYLEDFKGDVNKPADIRYEPDGIISVTAGDGFNFYFWSSADRGTIDPNDIAGVFTSVQAR
jgi:Right handed beta helix region